jgi:uncharacterized membrane protein YeaQ/YmgE (transglycosylase-associated protein family)
MWILLWIVFGALIGWLASIITMNNARMGAFANIIVGLLGALIGGFIAQLIGLGSYSEFSLGGILIALAGAVLLLLLVNLFRGGKR